LAAWGAGIALFLALGSKEVGLAALPLMFSLEALFRPLPGRRQAGGWIDRAAAFAPSLLAITIYLLLRVRALETLLSPQRVLPAENPLVALDGVERLATAIGLVARYAGLLFYPIRLSADYSGSVIGVESSLFAFRPVIGVVLLALCLVLAARPLLMRVRGETPTAHSALLAFAALLFLLPYLLIGNLFFEVGAVLAERFLYLPSAGFCMLLGLLLHSLHRATHDSRRKQGPAWVVLILGILVLAYGTRTWARCLDWRDDGSLFHAATLAQPRSPRAHYLLGRVLADRGERERALQHYGLATQHDPDLGAAWFETGVLLGQQRRYRQAEAAFREALRCVPTLGRAHLNLAIAVRRQGRPHEAERSLRKALLHEPRLAGAWAELGNLRLEQRRHAEAAEAYRRAIALGRSDLEPRLRSAERALAETLDDP
jgi:tetratricopeptide (TPR) repeat protein